MYIHKLKIGNVELENNILLAPMAGITDLAFRKICKEYGNPGLVYTEMASSRAIFHNDEKTKKLLDVEGEKRPIAVQIFGNDPKIMAFAASKVSEIADIIDINMGCPAPKVVKNGDGSKLLLNPELIGDIVQEVVKTVEKPVTVKMRKGWDKNNINAVEVAKIIEQAGASAITIHGRTREEYYSGRADLDIIKQVKESVNIPVIGNGDIKSIEDANKMFEYCNVDGIMIGRATIGNPWIINDIIKGEKREISNEEKLKVLKQHIELAVAEKGEYIAVREMRKHICWYIKNLKESSKIREKINKIENAEFYAGDVEEVLPKIIEKENIKPNVVFVDPPRKGLDNKTIGALKELKPEKIVYISCNPATLARDLALLDESYEIKEVQPVDMFPFSKHVENVTVLKIK